QPDSKWRIGAGEFAAILLFLIGWWVYRYKKLRRHRLVFLGLSLLVLGFWLNRPLSAVQFTSLLLGFLPSPATNLLFYIVLLGVILPLAFSGKNIYCAYICPYSALQEFAGKISGKNISLGKLRRFLPVIRNALLFTILMAAAITGKATAVAFEPFGVAFSLDLTAATYIWVILFVSLGLSFLFKRLWCIGFCPAGAFLDILRQISTALRRPRG
ncbi:MAG: 4Fe-4S binding protein, partial [Gracilibacteraceae bacterium]|nr:4Fe-4S binding protein [Gracilibacteraceae bacterium]